MTLDRLRTHVPRCDDPPAATLALPGLDGQHRVVLLHAPAGYGKTFRLAGACHHLRTRGARTAWLDLHGFDAGAAVLHRHLDAVLQAGTGMPLHLFIDGLDALRNTSAEALLARHIDASSREGGSDVRWLMASRGRPGLPLARWRAEGQLAEWSAADLRLDEAAAASLLQRSARQPLTAEQTSEALLRAEGWPVGLRLLGRHLAGSEGSVAAQGCPRDLANYFADEVLGTLDADLRTWLPAVGLLPRFGAALCDAVTGRGDSHRLIARLHQGGGFVLPLDDGGRTWRLHPLFAACVAQALDDEPAERTRLHRRASRWFAVQGQVDDALLHAERSADPTFLTETLDRCWDSVDRTGSFARMARLAQGLPRARLLRRPRVPMWQSAYLAAERRFEEAERLLDAVEQALARQPPAADEAAALRSTLEHRRMSLALLRDDIPACERHAERLKAFGPAPDPMLHAQALLATLSIDRQRWRLSACEAPAFASQALLMDLDHRPGLVWHACLVGPLLMQRGQVNGAAVHYRRAVADATALPGGDPADELAVMPLSLLAEAQLEQGEFDAARESFGRALACARAIGPLDASAALLIGRARLACHDGDTGTAQAMLDRAHALARARGFERLRWAVLHERVRQQLARGDVDGAQASAREAGLPADAAALAPGPDAPLAMEAQALARTRLWLAEGRTAQALRLARAWAHFGRHHGALSTAVRAELLVAQALQVLGEPRAAQRAAAQALALAGEGGMVFSFVEAPPPVRALLCAALEAAPAGLRSRLQALLATSARGLACDTTPTEALNAREADVLRHVARGLLYKEVGDRLGLTEGSVKWYMQQIYAKLGVRRRMAAIERARLLHYL